jgi:pimeloyl-ACP methyl ester carboxylesterase
MSDRVAPWSFAAPWGGTSHLVDLGGPVHWVDFGGLGGGPTFVLVHGLGGSHLNWALVAPSLTGRGRVVAVDLAGFGLTPAAGRPTTVGANARLLGRFVREVIGPPVILVGNSMGGMVCVLHTNARPDTVSGLVLVDPSLPVPPRLPDPRVAAPFLAYAVPVVGERYLSWSRSRRSSRQLVQQVVDLCFADPSRASAALLDAATDLAEHRRDIPGQHAAFLQAARSLMFLLARPGRYPAMLRALDLPVLLVHGERDRLVPVAAARAALAGNPGWDSAFLAGVGHTPQLEAPADVARHLTGWLDRHHLASQQIG